MGVIWYARVRDIEIHCVYSTGTDTNNLCLEYQQELLVLGG